GGPDGELGASLRYLSQRFSMPMPELKAILTDIATEELGHLEMVGAIVHQLTRNLTEEEIKKGGFDAYFVDHTTGIYPSSASGVPFTAAYVQSKGDPITDLHEDLAAEQKARTTYDNILRFTDDPDVRDPIKFLRQREVVHYQRFGEGLRRLQDKLNDRNFYACNPSFDKPQKPCK
ncbi:MAG: manganese catalase family protein, partial [Clostridia bacterium]|nr:manganese catalase family protein [Clostridia bacterium]